MSSRPCHNKMVIDDQALIKAYNEGVPVKKLSEMFGYSPSALAARALRLGCKRRLYDATKLPIRSILQAYTEFNLTRTEIAKRVGCAPTTIGRVLRKYGIKCRLGRRTPQLIEQCVRLIRSGLSAVEAGKRLKLSESQVRNRVRPILGRLPHWPKPCAPIEKLLELKESGMTFGEIGKMYNRHEETIRSRIARHYRLQAVKNG